MSPAAGVLHSHPVPEVILPMTCSPRPKLSRKRRIDWDDEAVVVIVDSESDGCGSSSSPTIPPDTSSVSLSVSGTSTTSATSSADHGTNDTQPDDMGSASSEGDWITVVHSDICECSRCIAEHGEIHVRLF